MSKTHTVPDNLPVEPIADAQDHLGMKPEARPSMFRWGAFKLTQKQLDEFHAVLEGHLGSPLPWTREEVELMHYEMLRLVALLAEHELRRRPLSDANQAES